MDPSISPTEIHIIILIIWDIMDGHYRNENDEWVPVPRPIEMKIVIRNSILNALAYTDGNQKEAGKLLGLSERVMNYHMKIHYIPRFRAIKSIKKKSDKESE